jgi:hypothetical protein
MSLNKTAKMENHFEKLENLHEVNPQGHSAHLTGHK